MHGQLTYPVQAAPTTAVWANITVAGPGQAKGGLVSVTPLAGCGRWLSFGTGTAQGATWPHFNAASEAVSFESPVDVVVWALQGAVAQDVVHCSLGVAVAGRRRRRRPRLAVSRWCRLGWDSRARRLGRPWGGGRWMPPALPFLPRSASPPTPRAPRGVNASKPGCQWANGCAAVCRRKRRWSCGRC